ncbi:MAG: ATP-binding protein [Elusimicrobia bacterium]|nr:ATP-binding protein [Elusimicrobiota bacterium]
MIVQGARQVGKTWLMQEFAKKYYKKAAYITFEDKPDIQNIFYKDLDPKRILQDIEAVIKMKITPEDTLIIFDEIQECPKALTSLKYFNENAPEYDIVCAGSLLGVTLHTGTSFPVGKVDFMDLYPLSFLEFLDAIGEWRLVNILESLDFEHIRIFGDTLFRYLRYYFYIGGMPEVVQNFIEQQDFINVRKIQKRILNSYEQDFSKHIEKNMVERIKMVWQSVPAQLTKENKKFIYGAVKTGGRAKDFELAIAWLRDSGLIHKVHRITKPELPLKFYEDFDAFKLFINDIGLLSSLCRVDSKILIENSKIFEEFNGALTEQYVLQQLKGIDKDIFYWSKENGKSEIDLMIQLGENVVPIEAKSGTNLKAKSLLVYTEKYKPAIAIRTSIADYKKVNSLYDVPLYAIENFCKKFNVEKV